MDVAIIGLGPWGLSALERFVTATRRQGSAAGSLTIHIVEPNPPGSGVYRTTQPDYLLLNNPCGQLSLWADGNSDDGPRYAVGLYDWATREGYRWDGYRCRVGQGRAITPHDYLPRRVMGEYLNWFYRALLSEVPPGVQIAPHRTTAVDLRSRPGGREEILLADGRTLDVDHAVLTLGHTPNQSRVDTGGSAVLEPYPVESYVETLPPTSTVAVAGMGLVAIDVAVALTIGRGGRFVEEGRRLRYLPSGQEPSIHMYSRSGSPYCAKAVAAGDDTGDYRAVICTPELLAALRRTSDGSVDLRTQVLPAAFAEMQLRYLSQSARLAEGEAAAVAVREVLGRAWSAGDYDGQVDQLAHRYGRFDPAEHFLGRPQTRYDSSKEYQAEVYDNLASDLDESLMEGGSSPVKHAYEVWRINRDDLRTVIEYGGLSLASYRDFEANLRNRVNRLIAGPPAIRSQQLLALMDAGVLVTPYGPAPGLQPGIDDGVDIGSRAFDKPWADQVDCVVQGHLEHPTVHRSATPLLVALYRGGRLQQLRYGELPVGSVALTRDFHPINARGEVETTLSMFGVLTEGTRYFTHYLPSPKSRLRAVQDMGECVASILE